MTAAARQKLLDDFGLFIRASDLVVVLKASEYGLEPCSDAVIEEYVRNECWNKAYRAVKRLSKATGLRWSLLAPDIEDDEELPYVAHVTIDDDVMRSLYVIKLADMGIRIIRKPRWSR